MGEAGGRIKGFKISQVRYVPGRLITVQHRVEVVWSDGKPTTEVIVASSGLKVPEDIPVFATNDVEVAFWRFPNDPFLPGPPSVSDSTTAAGLLSQLGEQTNEAAVRVRSYRAGRRAVIEVNTPSHRLFVKVVRPDRTAALQDDRLS